jgi:hypothetical protein
VICELADEKTEGRSAGGMSPEGGLY